MRTKRFIFLLSCLALCGLTLGSGDAEGRGNVWSSRAQRALEGLLNSSGASAYQTNDSGQAVIAQIIHQRTGLGTTSTDGLVLENTTAAAAGAQQISSRVRWTGQGWKTDAVEGSQQVDYILELVPVQGSAAPQVELNFKYQKNGGGYTKALTLRDNDMIFNSGRTLSPYQTTRSGYVFPIIAGDIGTMMVYSTGSPLQLTTTEAGVDVYLSASDAVAGSSVAGAGAGGNVYITAGDSQRLTSGNANGGKVHLFGGNGIGTGIYGGVQINNLNSAIESSLDVYFLGNFSQTAVINTESSSTAVKRALLLQNKIAVGTGSGVSQHFAMANRDLGGIKAYWDGAFEILSFYLANDWDSPGLFLQRPNQNLMNVGIGQSTFGTSAAKVLSFGGPATPPTTRPPDAFTVYPFDVNGAGTMGLAWMSEDNGIGILGLRNGFGTIAPGQFTEFEELETITGAVTDGYAAALRLDPGYTAATALTVTRHNFVDYQNPSVAGAGPAALTDAAIGRFDAAAGTHKAVDAGTTKTSPGTVGAWVKWNLNGVIYYTPMYTSKTD